jgi:DNA-binding MarR family transcriptional regulator
MGDNGPIASPQVSCSMRSQAKRDNDDATPRKRAARPPAAKRAGSHRTFRFAPTVSIPALLDGADGGDTQFRQLLYDIAIAAAHLESARSYLATKMGLTPPQYNMVMIIAQFEGPTGISVSDVAAHLHVNNTFVTTEIKKLARMGLVAKEPNPADARSVLLRLTPQGEERVRALEPELLFVNDRLFGGMSKADFQSLSRIVASIIDDFSRTVAVLGALGRSSPATRTDRVR